MQKWHIFYLSVVLRSTDPGFHLNLINNQIQKLKKCFSQDFMTLKLTGNTAEKMQFVQETTKHNENVTFVRFYLNFNRANF